jgi:hypothetical protein
MKKIAVIALVLWFAGCANVVKVEGDQTVNTRLSVKVADAWNKISIGGQTQPFDVWTQDGLSLDHLRFWAAVKGGQNLIVAPAGSTPVGQKVPRMPTYRAGMPADELVGLFELMYAVDGSIVTMGKVAPVRFAGEQGVRFEFAVVRKSDGVQLQGVGWVAVRNSELFGASFVAPRLAFFPRLLPKVEAIVATATIK